MSDRELLELAAKACGYIRMEYRGDTPYVSADLSGNEFEAWNPLTDDGDALRLAVKLELTILPGGGDVEVAAYENERDEGGGTLSYPVAMEETTGDKFSATRRAIVRAAAEIGKTSTTDTAQQGG